MKLRPIREEEKNLVIALLEHAKKSSEFPISSEVSEYGDPFMGSINFNNNRPDLYAGDLAQCEYTDKDGENVVVSLTYDQEGKLLDLDFWKSNFTSLINYPDPKTVYFKPNQN